MSLKINKRQLKKWIAALDSGKYKQGKNNLHNECGYCCLGVGCEVLIPEKLLSINADGFIDGGIVEHQPAAPKWFKEIDDDFRDITETRLTILNDDRGFTFPEIATLLELVYVHKILD